MLKRCQGAVGIAAAFAQQAQAGRLTLLGTQVELPFDDKVPGHSGGFESNYGLRSCDSYALEIAGGDAKGQKIPVGTEYCAPSGIEAGVVQNWVRGAAQTAIGVVPSRAPPALPAGRS
jgi:hypothetical protein